MTDEIVVKVGVAIYSSFVLMMLWYLYFILWDDYCTAELKQDFRDIHLELRRYGMSGGISLQSEAYCRLEATINALSRYVRHINFMTLAVAEIAHLSTRHDYGDGLQQQIENDCSLSSDQQEFLRDLHSRLIWSCIRHIRVTSITGRLGFIFVRLISNPRSPGFNPKVNSQTGRPTPAIPKIVMRHLEYVENQMAESVRHPAAR